MTPKQFVELIKDIADTNGLVMTTDWDGEEWGTECMKKGCTITSSNCDTKEEYNDDKAILAEIRELLWNDLRIVANRPRSNGRWQEGCLLNIDFKQNKHQWTTPGTKAFQIVEEVYEGKFVPTFGSFDVYKKRCNADFMAYRLFTENKQNYRVEEIEITDEMYDCGSWMYLDVPYKKPKL